MRIRTKILEKHFRKMFEHADRGMALVTRNFHFTRINEAFCKITEYSQEEIRRLSLHAIVHREERASIEEQLLEMRSGQAPFYQAEHRLINKLGQCVWVVLTIAWVCPTDNQPRHMMLQIQDISARRNAEEQQKRLRNSIEDSAREWQLTCDTVESPILLIDSALNIVRLNEAARRLAGTNLRQFSGQLLGSVNSSALWQAINNMAERLSAAGGRDSTEVVDTEREITWQLDGNSVENERNEIRTAIVARDITKLRQTQETLLQANRLSTLGSLVGCVAHEVRNPLFILSATMDAWEAVEGSNSKIQKYTVPLREQVDRLNDLMQELLEYGKPPQEIQSVGRLDLLIAQAVKICEPLAWKRKVKLRNLAGPELLVVMDSGRLQRAFRNVIENALQHAPTRSEVRIETQKVLRGGEPWIECIVRDCGSGFQPADLPKVFEPFFTRRRGGTGIGLALVQRIVEQHNGRVSAENAAEGGAVVKISLPDKSERRPVSTEAGAILGNTASRCEQMACA